MENSFELIYSRLSMHEMQELAKKDTFKKKL